MSVLLGQLLAVVIAAPMLSAVLARGLPIRGHRWIAIAGIAVSLLGTVALTSLRVEGEVAWPASQASGRAWLSLQAADALPGVLASAAALVALLQTGGTSRRDASAVAASLAGSLLAIFGGSAGPIVVGLLVGTGGLAMLLGTRRGPPLRPAFLLAHAITIGLMLVGLVALAHDGSPMSPRVSYGLLAVAVLARVGVPPLHGSMVRVFAAASPAGRLLVGTLVPLTSLVVLAEQRVGLGPGWGPWHATVGVMLVMYGSLAALGAASVHRVASGFAIATLGSAVVLLGMTPLLSSAQVLAVVAASTGPAAIAVVAALLQRRVGTDAFASLGGLSRTMPRLMSLAIASSLVAAGLPGSGGFASLVLSMGELMQERSIGMTSLAVMLAVAWVLQVSAAVRLVRRVFFGEPASPVGPTPPDLDGRESLALAVPVAFAVLAGVLPFAA